MSRQPLVTLEGIRKSFGDYVAVQPLDLAIHAGEFLALMGSSGCGKTTTLRMLAGLESPSAGTIRLSGQPINHLPAWQRDTPLVWQNLALFPFLNVIENVEFALKMRGVGRAERRRRAEAWLDRMQIAEFAGRAISHLSGGQRQRVALARSLVIEPQILLLDEPLSALDAALKVRMQSVLKSLQRETGITFVYVTHSQSEAFAMADRVVIMSRGKVEQIGTPQDIYNRPGTRFVAEFLGSSNILSGRVTGSTGPHLNVDGPLGHFQVPHCDATPPQSGQEIDFSVLGALCDLGPPGGDPRPNQIDARIVGEEFEGAFATIYLEADTGQELRVQKSQADIARLEPSPGKRMAVFWRAQDCHLLPG
ncbi:ATP-binding cassette domain-containing protein [bacterium]|nr:ATP-binding cassette domain-containing protein [bacterium]